MKDATTPLEALLKRDRAIVLGALLAIAALAWTDMAREARSMSLTGICACAGMKMSGPDLRAWDPRQMAPLFLMWTEMMVAMMLPSAAPMILMFAMLNRQRRARARPYVPAAFFVTGYLLIWTAFSAAAAFAQWVLHANALLSPMMAGTSPRLEGALLLAAGAFQWTRLKHACLAHCRSPLAFFTAEWREGWRGALAMGFKHGAYCTGCCWILMALLFVAGVMNMEWVAALTILVLLEKVLPQGIWVGRFAGVVLAIWGALILL